jgi:hypothetical protein
VMKPSRPSCSGFAMTFHECSLNRLNRRVSPNAFLHGGPSTRQVMTPSLPRHSNFSGRELFERHYVGPEITRRRIGIPLANEWGIGGEAGSLSAKMIHVWFSGRSRPPWESFSCVGCRTPEIRPARDKYAPASIEYHLF